MEQLLDVLKATGEPTRLRIVVVLSRCELTVGELCRVLGQSQPRVSRHLKLLCDAGVLERHAQGTSAFYRPARSGQGKRVTDAVLSFVDDSDPVVLRDLDRLAAVRAERAEVAAGYFEQIAADWDQLRTLHVADEDVEAAMLAAAEGLDIGQLLDIGTGTGRVLEIFADRIDQGLGLDLSGRMLDVARSRLDELGFDHCAVRQGNAYDLPLDQGTVDVAVLHHVLHFLDDPQAAIREVARTLRSGGRLLIVDFAPHPHERMRSEFAHHWLGFADDEVVEWCESEGFDDVDVQHLTRSDAPRDGSLTVTLWTATQTADHPHAVELAR
jgi:ArsR family transcriptional regulator